MTSTGYNFPSTIGQAQSGTTWIDLTNVSASDNAYASLSSSLSAGQASKSMVCLGFGFSIPEPGTIQGITVKLERSTGTTPSDLITDFSVRLLKNSVAVGDDKADLVTNWPTSDAEASYGAINDLWGTTWTTGDINLSTFGVLIRAHADAAGTSTIARIDAISIAVEYTGTSTTLEVGAFAFTGQEINLDTPMRLAVGAFAFGGQDMLFIEARVIELEVGSFAFNGYDARMIAPGQAGNPGVVLHGIRSSKVRLPQP